MYVNSRLTNTTHDILLLVHNLDFTKMIFLKLDAAQRA